MLLCLIWRIVKTNQSALQKFFSVLLPACKRCELGDVASSIRHKRLWRQSSNRDQWCWSTRAWFVSCWLLFQGSIFLLIWRNTVLACVCVYIIHIKHFCWLTCKTLKFLQFHYVFDTMKTFVANNIIKLHQT